MTFFTKTTLSNGLRVITEEIPHVRSASLGIWVRAGSLWESPAEAGISHFIEHMLFKGTRSRTARQIAQAIDGRGGSLNAFTAKEQTCYYAKVLDEHLPVAMDVLADMVLHSTFDPAEMEKEKGVILEEIKMYEDVPDDVVHDLFTTVMWPDHAMGRPIVGTGDTVQAFTRESLLDYFAGHYTPEEIVIAAAGNLRHESVVDLVDRTFAEWHGHTAGRERAWPAPPPGPARSRALVRVKDTEQAHLVLGVKGLPQEDDDIYALHLINTVFGGGSSSRLFQAIREDRGLAYSVYSYQTSFRDTGNFAVYAGISPKVVPDVLELLSQSYRLLGEEGLTAEELAEAKDQLKGQIMLSLESTSGRMTRLGRGELMLGRVLTPDEIISRIDSVTADQVQALCARLFLQEPYLLSAVGPLADGLDLQAAGFEEVHYD